MFAFSHIRAPFARPAPALYRGLSPLCCGQRGQARCHGDTVPAGNAHPHAGFELCRAVPVPALAALLPIPFPAVKEHFGWNCYCPLGTEKTCPRSSSVPKDNSKRPLESPHCGGGLCIINPKRRYSNINYKSKMYKVLTNRVSLPEENKNKRKKKPQTTVTLTL